MVVGIAITLSRIMLKSSVCPLLELAVGGRICIGYLYPSKQFTNQFHQIPFRRLSRQSLIDFVGPSFLSEVQLHNGRLNDRNNERTIAYSLTARSTHSIGENGIKR